MPNARTAEVQCIACAVPQPTPTPLTSSQSTNPHIDARHSGTQCSRPVFDVLQHREQPACIRGRQRLHLDINTYLRALVAMAAAEIHRGKYATSKHISRRSAHMDGAHTYRAVGRIARALGCRCLERAGCHDAARTRRVRACTCRRRRWWRTYQRAGNG